MAARSIASLSLSFGLVSIPVKLYTATESGSAVRFNLLHKCGSRLKQQYVCIDEGVVVERAEMVKGYEFEKDRYVTFEAAELKALEEAARQTVDIVSFVPLAAVDPIYYDKAYYLAPDKRGAKPYRLLLDAMRASGRCALARWAWKGKQYVVQLRPGDGALVLQQLLYADEVRTTQELAIEEAQVSAPELQLALQLIDQIAAETYRPADYQDEEKARLLAAIDEKIAGHAVVVAKSADALGADAQIIDLTEALRASLGARPAAGKAAVKAAVKAPSAAPQAPAADVPAANPAPARKPARRAVATGAVADALSPAAAPRARKAG